jgi:hypothetical protein
MHRRRFVAQYGLWIKPLPQLIERVHWIPLRKLRPKRLQRPRISRALNLSPVHLEREERRERRERRERSVRKVRDGRYGEENKREERTDTRFVLLVDIPIVRNTALGLRPWPPAPPPP